MNPTNCVQCKINNCTGTLFYILNSQDTNLIIKCNTCQEIIVTPLKVDMAGMIDTIIKMVDFDNEQK